MSRTPSPKTPSPTHETPPISHEKVSGSDKSVRSWKTLFDGNLAIGENHDEIAAKKWLIQNMGRFKAEGYDTIFMEHLSQKEHQYQIEEYYKSDEMSEELASDLERLNVGHRNDLSVDRVYYSEWKKYNFKTIIGAAKSVGIKIIGLEKSMRAYHEEGRGYSRTLTFNDRAKKIIEETVNSEAGAGSKWIAFVGLSHLNEFRDVSGICEIIDGVQDLAILDAENKDEELTLFSSTKQKFKFGEGVFLASMVLMRGFASDVTYNPDLECSGVKRKRSSDEESEKDAGGAGGAPLTVLSLTYGSGGKIVRPVAQKPLAVKE
jgi:hypothetical protein